MTFIPVPQCVHVKFSIKTGTAELPANFGLYFQRQEFGSAEMEGLLDELESGFCADVMAHLDSNYNMHQITAWDLRSVDGYKATKAVNIDGGSAPGNTPLSPADCMVVSFHSAKRGKWNQGRVFLAGISEQNADQVDINGTLITEELLAFTNLISDPPTGWTWVIVSRRLNKQPRTEGIWSAVTGALVRSPRFGIQRRRAQRP
jgi:hypothetical protein